MDFFISDTHFGHSNVLKFTKADGSPLRSFASVEEMHDRMVDAWNSVVRPGDTVYHLGDVAFQSRQLAVLDRMVGRKILIAGNHDIYSHRVYARYFDDVRGAYVLRRKTVPYGQVILTHVPIHPMEMGRFLLNIHGHLHSNRVMTDSGVPDPRYFCASVEQLDYTPISLDELREITLLRDINSL